MSGSAPRALCRTCSRPVLNNRFARCLYCGAGLAQQDLAPDAVTVQFDAETARQQEEARRKHQRDESCDEKREGVAEIIGELLDNLPDIGELFD